MGLAAAEFHEDPGLGSGFVDGVGEGLDGGGVAVFVEVFHGGNVDNDMVS